MRKKRDAEKERKRKNEKRKERVLTFCSFEISLEDEAVFGFGSVVSNGN
jgi:hypothetical protein